MEATQLHNWRYAENIKHFEEWPLLRVYRLKSSHPGNLPHVPKNTQPSLTHGKLLGGLVNWFQEYCGTWHHSREGLSGMGSNTCTVEAFTASPERRLGLTALNPRQSLNQRKNSLTFNTHGESMESAVREKHPCWYVKQFCSESPLKSIDTASWYAIFWRASLQGRREVTHELWTRGQAQREVSERAGTSS